MAKQAQILRVVIGSPGDVQAERDIVCAVVEEVNKSISVDRGLRLETIRWETDAHPGFHPDGPQGLIDPILRIEDCDVLVGLFWKRFGTPTKDSSSGTAHEFRLAYESWKKNRRPQVMVYFNQKSYTPQSKEETDQWGQVLEFRKEFPKEGLWWPYKGTAEFEKLLRTHLVYFIRANFPLGETQHNTPSVKALGHFRELPRSPVERADYFAVQVKIIAEYTRTFVGRVSAQQAFGRFLDTHRRGYFIVRGGPGQGKTAVSCHLVKTGEYIHHFISRTGGRTDPRLILRSLVSQLLPLAEASGDIPESLPELTKLFEELLPDAVTRKKKVVIVIDALDELPGETNEEPPYLVADALPEGVFYVVTSRPGDRLDRLQERRFAIPHQLYELGPLELSEMREIMRSRKPDITAAEVDRIAEASQGNPLYLRAVFDQLGINPAYNLQTLPDRIEGFFRNATSGLSTGNSILGNVLSLLCVARTPLSLQDIGNIIGSQQREVYEQGIRRIRQFLLEIDGCYTFYHTRFHEFVTRTILFEDELRKCHRRIADWLQHLDNCANEARWASLAYHLFESGSHEELIKTIDEEFLAQKVRRFGYAVLEDVELLTRSLLELGDPSLLERCVSLVESLREVVGGDIIPDAAKAVQSYHPGPESFRTRLIVPSVPSVPGLDVYVAVLPKAEVPADFFEIISMNDRLVLAIGDAPRIGLKSAFVARFIGNLFRKLVEKSSTLDLGEVLTSLNSRIAANDYFERVSMQCAEFNPRRGILHIANAGHPYPVHYSARRGKCDILPVRGNLLHNSLGEASGREQFEQYTLGIGPGDIFVLISDGLTEGHLLGSDPYGYRFTKAVEARSKEGSRAIGEAILESWRAHPREDDSADDVSIIVVTWGANSRTIVKDWHEQ
jgi:hypothetical protein